MANIELRGRYCVSIPGLLKWLAIVSSDPEVREHIRGSSPLSISDLLSRRRRPDLLGSHPSEGRRSSISARWRNVHAGRRPIHHRYRIPAAFGLLLQLPQRAVQWVPLPRFGTCSSGPLEVKGPLLTRFQATWIYFLCLLLWIAAASVQTWVTTELKKKWFQQEDYVNRRAASAVSSPIFLIFRLLTTRFGFFRHSASPTCSCLSLHCTKPVTWISKETSPAQPVHIWNDIYACIFIALQVFYHKLHLYVCACVCDTHV